MTAEQDSRALEMARDVQAIEEKLDAQDEELKELRDALGDLNAVVAFLRSSVRRIEKPRFRPRFRR